ncbi:hypothetical protein Ahia01_000233000 [Argonauta hians]
MSTDCDKEVPFKPPAFCRENQCPQFKVISKTDDYELREYKRSHWVATSRETPKPVHSGSGMFFSLLRYIQGQNADKKSISMTVPVATKINKPAPPPPSSSAAAQAATGGGGGGEGKGETEGPWTQTMHFYLTSDENPAPSGADVFLTEQPAMRVYVRSFPGFAKEKDWNENLASLKAALPPGSYDETHYYTAGYDSPFQFFNRHNEVWLRAKLPPPTTTTPTTTTTT